MNKIMALIFLIILAVLPMTADAWRDADRMTMSWADTLGVATTADTIYSGWINISDYDYVAANILLEVTSGGSAGAGTIGFQGRVSDNTNYETIWFVNMSDSFEIATTEAISDTVSLFKTCLLSVQPVGSLKAQAEAAEDTDTQLFYGNLLPYEGIRAILIDTNWDAAVDVSGDWILKRH